MLNWFLKKINNRKGFTLIELIVVIAILGVLAAIAIPRLVGFQDSAKERATLADAKTLASTVSVLTAQNYTFTSTDGADTTADVYSNAEIMGYAGLQSGGKLTLTVNGSGGLTSFQYDKQFGDEYFSAVYTFDGDELEMAATPKTTGTITATAIDTTFE